MANTKRVAVFVDGSNLFYTQRNMGWIMSLDKFLSYIEDTYGNIVDAYYYIGKGTPPAEGQQQFLDAVVESGYTLVTKTLKTIRNEDGMVKKKANLDIEIVLDMFNTIDTYDLAVLVSGDGDFDRALQQLRARGKEFFVFSTDEYVAKEIRQTAGRRYINLETLKDDILHKEISPF